MVSKGSAKRARAMLARAGTLAGRVRRLRVNAVDPNPSKASPFWLIAMLAAVTAAGPFAMQIFLPALPAIARSFDVPAATAQLTLSVSMIAIAVATLIYGPLSDRYGRQPVLRAGIVIFIAGSVACYLAPTVELLILARVVQAAGGAAGLVLARAIARDLYGPEQSARVIAQLTLIMVLAPMLAPGIGGLISDLFGWRPIFLVVSAAGLIVLTGTTRFLAESHHRRTRADSPLDLVRGFGSLLRSPRFCLLAAYPAFSAMVFFTFISGAPYLMVDVLERPATEYGLYFILIAAGFMLGNFVTVRFGYSVGLLPMMIIGMWIATAGVLTCAAFVALDMLSPLTLFLPITVAQIGQGLGMPNAQAAAINVIPYRAGTASALVGFLQMTFAAIASQAVGVLLQDTAWPLILLMLLGVTGALTVALVARSIGEPPPVFQTGHGRH
jgi:MFS transporter, DHA1 family, multidrug resistance protein